MALTLTATRKSDYGEYGLTRSGWKVDKDLYDAVQRAAELTATMGPGCAWGAVEWLQGGLNAGEVTASAMTHAGLAVGDFRTRGKTKKQIWAMCTALMLCGVIGFIRGVVDRMDPHFHVVGVPAANAHSSARAQIYNARYGYKYGGAGLEGAPRARWYGPARKPLITWGRSKFNPNNAPGWFYVDPKMIGSADNLVGLSKFSTPAKVRVVARHPAGWKFEAVRMAWAKLGADGKEHKYAVTSNGVHYRVDYLNRGSKS